MTDFNRTNHAEKAAADWLMGGGEMGRRVRSFDWSQTPLGPLEQWPQSLRTAASICLSSKFPMVIWWGPDLILLYNDAWRPILGENKDRRALGSPGREIWAEIWDVIGPMFQQVMTTGQATWSDDGLLLVNRYGYIEEAYFTWSYSPIREESGSVGGVFTAVTETTGRVIGERRMHALRDLAACSVQARDIETACRNSAEVLAQYPYDFPFALLYRLSGDRRMVRLAGTAGVEPDACTSPRLVNLQVAPSPEMAWPLIEVAQTGQATVVRNLSEIFDDLPSGVWNEAPREAVVLPVILPGQDLPELLLVLAVSPRQPFDDECRSFFNLVTGQIAATLDGNLIPPEQWPGARALRGQTVSPGMEMIHTAADGKETWTRISTAPLHDEAGEVIGAIAIVEDIDESKRREEELRKNTAILSAISENTSELIFVKDRNGRLIYANPATLGAMGISPERAFSADPAARFPAREEAEAIHDNDRRVMESGVAETFEEIYTGEGITTRVYLSTKTPLRDKDGAIIGLIGISKDISERKQGEEALRVAMEREKALRVKTEEANRLKDEFLAIVSHELKTPLNSIHGWASLLNAGKLSEKESAEAMETIARNAKIQKQLIEDLLDVSRIVTGKMRLHIREVALHEVIHAAIKTMRHAAEAKGIDLQVESEGVTMEPVIGEPDSLIIVSGDFDRLQQVIWNLVSNAIKFTPAGGRVGVTARRAGASWVEIIVHDTGKGIRPEFLPYVFDRFRQEDASKSRKEGGLGLGLAIVRQLTEMHGGEVRVESEGEGMGATFVVSLPLPGTTQLQSQSAPAWRNSANNMVELTGTRVLVVDDERDAQALICFILEHAGAEVRSADSAAEGFKVIDEWKPDLIVADIGMPDMDGYEFMRSLRGRRRERGGLIPAVALTAYSRLEDRLQTMAAGYQLHVAKPVEPDEFMMVVAKLLGR